MPEPVVIGRWRYPLTGPELRDLHRLAAAWCRSNGYTNPDVVFDGHPLAEPGFMTIIATPTTQPEGESNG